MLGIVIVNYLDYARTERFIREELSRISCPYRVVVVDNGNDASGAETLRQHTGCQVLVLENNGFAAGCNAGPLPCVKTRKSMSSCLRTTTSI